MAVNKPYFTVIIPTLNEEHFLPRLLNDLSEQKDQDFEVVVVDASSEDKTCAVAQEYATKLSLQVLTSPKKNPSFQRNYGAKKGKGKYFIFLDADCRVEPQFIKLLRKNCKQYKHLVYLPTMIAQTTKQSYKILFKFVNFIIEVSQNGKKPFPTGGVFIFEKHFFHFLGGYRVVDTQDKQQFFPDDNDIIMRVKKAGVTAKFLTDVAVHFCLRRMEREGELKVFATYLSAVLMTTQGTHEGTSIKYEMGGHLYNQEPTEEKWIDDFIHQTKKLLS